MKGAMEEGRGRKIKNFNLPDKTSKTFYHIKTYKRESSCTRVFHVIPREHIDELSTERKKQERSNPDPEFFYTRIYVSDIRAFSLADWTFPVE